MSSAASSSASLVDEQRCAPVEPSYRQSASTLHSIASSALKPGRPKELWNWGGTFRARPRIIFDPVTVQQCCALVELARREGREIRAVGRAHSPGDLMWTSDWIVRMKGLEGLVKIDQALPSITVLGGTYVSAIHEMLAAADPPLAMSNVGSISEQTIGGLISTATHGTGIGMPPVSALILSMRLIVALPIGQGGVQVVRCSPTERPELFNATLCGLGCTGLIVEAEIKVEPAFCLRQVAEEMPFDFLFGASSRAPSVIAQAQSPSFRPTSSRGKATPSVEWTASESTSSAAEPTISHLHETPVRECVGHLLAQGRRIPTASPSYLPRVRNEATGAVWPVSPAAVDDASRLTPPDEDDDEETRAAQRRIEWIVNGTQHAKIMYWPQARMCTLFRQDRTFEPPVQATLASRMYGRVIGHDLAQFLLFVSRYHRSLPPRVGKLVFGLTHPSPPRRQKTHHGAHGQSGFQAAAAASPNLAPAPAHKKSTPTTRLHTSPNLNSDGTPLGVSAVGRASESEEAGGKDDALQQRSSGYEQTADPTLRVASVGRTTEEEAAEAAAGACPDDPAPALGANVAAASDVGARVGALRSAVRRSAVDRPGLPAHRVSLEDFLSGGSKSATPSTFSPVIDRASASPKGARTVPKMAGVHAPLSTDHATYTSVNTSHLIFNMDCLFPQYTTEWAIPFQHTAAAIRALRDWLEAEEASSKGERPHFPVEIRFGDADGIWLSPNQGRKTCYIGLIQFRPYNRPTRYRLLFERFEALMRHFAGRPHWAKSHTCGHAELRKLYPHLDDFLKLRGQVDPDGVFLNPYVRRHLLGEIGPHTNPRTFKARL